MILTDGQHLVSTTSLDELHAFAQKIGLKRSWFQDESIPHYDMMSDRICKAAASHGAEIVSIKDLVRLMRKAF